MQLYWNHTSEWGISKFAALLQNTFLKNTYGGLPLDIYTVTRNTQILVSCPSPQLQFINSTPIRRFSPLFLSFPYPVSHILTLIPGIPRIPTLIPIIPTLIPRVPTLIPRILTLVFIIATLISRIPTLIPRILCIPTLIPRIAIIPFIPFLDFPLLLLQIG